MQKFIDAIVWSLGFAKKVLKIAFWLALWGLLPFYVVISVLLRNKK